MIKSTTGNFPSSIPDFWFKKELLDFGDYSLLYRKFAKKEKLPPGNGVSWKANRYTRIELPMDALSEGVTPDETSMQIEQVSCTAAQYGMVVTLTDVLQLTMDHPVLQKAVELVKEAMDRLDSEIICEVLLAGTVVQFANAVGGSNNSRDDLASTDIFSTTEIKLAVAQLEFPDDTWGSAPKFGSGKYACILHRKHELDLLSDSLWKEMAIRQDKSALDKGSIASWMGVDFYVTNWGPKFHTIGDPTLTDGVAASSTVGLDGLILDEYNGSGSLTAAAHDFVVTRRHKHRRFEDGISGIIDYTISAPADTIDFTMPASTSYVYSLYGALNNGTLYRIAANQAAGAVVTVTSLPSSGVVAPVSPASAVNVYCSWVMGRDAYAVVDLDNLEAGITDDARTGEDPLKQRRKVAAKFMLGGLILADNNLVRIEAASAF
jgi:N4-gp56 family major capsid protein